MHVNNQNFHLLLAMFCLCNVGELICTIVLMSRIA